VTQVTAVDELWRGAGSKGQGGQGCKVDSSQGAGRLRSHAMGDLLTPCACPILITVSFPRPPLPHWFNTHMKPTCRCVRPGSVGSTCHCPFHRTGHTHSLVSCSEQPARQDREADEIFLLSSLQGRADRRKHTGSWLWKKNEYITRPLGQSSIAAGLHSILFWKQMHQAGIVEVTVKVCFKTCRV
jgi:hypothetical protein